MRTIAVQAQCDDGEDELKGAKREVEVNHGGFRSVPWFLPVCGCWNVGYGMLK